MGVQNFPELATGDVTGPASATNGNLAVFDGTTGKIIEDGGAVPDPAAILATTITNGDTTHAPDGNVVFDALYNNFRTQATAATTTTLVAADKIIQEFTGTTTQTVTLPVVSTLTVGRQFLVINNSTGSLTVNSSGGNLVATVTRGQRVLLECVLITGTDAASWTVIRNPASSAAGAILLPNTFSATAPGLAFDNDATLGLTSSANTIFMTQNGTTIKFGFFGSLQLTLPSGYQFGWAAADPQSGNADTGFARDGGAASVRATNGSTGSATFRARSVIVENSGASVSPAITDYDKTYRCTNAAATLVLPTTGLTLGLRFKAQFSAGTGTIDAGSGKVVQGNSGVLFVSNQTVTALQGPLYNIEYVATDTWAISGLVT